MPFPNIHFFIHYQIFREMYLEGKEREGVQREKSNGRTEREIGRYIQIQRDRDGERDIEKEDLELPIGIDKFDR